MSNEWGNISVGDSVTNGRVDQVREESDTVLEISVDNLHDTGRELHDTDFRGLLHLGASIQETIRRDTGVGIN